MTVLEAVVAVLARHREARRWQDEAVARDVVAVLGMNPDDDASHATGAVEATHVTEDHGT